MTARSRALLAAHWAGAAGPDAPAKVERYARAAGHEALRVFEPATAAKWFELALASLTDEHGRGTLVAELAQARQLAGHPDGVATLREAVQLALASPDDELSVGIVEIAGSGWWTLPGIPIEETHRLLDRALRARRHDDAIRSRILALRAVTLHPAQADEAERLADEAVALARASNDPNARDEALLRRGCVALSPHSLVTRRERAPRAVGLRRVFGRPGDALLRAQRRRDVRDPGRRPGDGRAIRSGGGRDRRAVRPRSYPLERDGAAGVENRARG